MEAAQIVVVLVLLLACPVALAWAQSRWEISRERRREARISSRITPTAVPVSTDQATRARGGLNGAAIATEAAVPDPRPAASGAGFPVDDPWKSG
jgi:hypothetical protein